MARVGVEQMTSSPHHHGDHERSFQRTSQTPMRRGPCRQEVGHRGVPRKCHRCGTKYAPHHSGHLRGIDPRTFSRWHETWHQILACHYHGGPHDATHRGRHHRCGTEPRRSIPQRIPHVERFLVWSRRSGHHTESCHYNHLHANSLHHSTHHSPTSPRTSCRHRNDRRHPRAAFPSQTDRDIRSRTALERAWATAAASHHH
mmetsp:Transcript_31898/g.36848  ORF Transcript_31898/g.36848 Transcript_31898/m.36848 type:complete len:201 (+) Transcript_31898:2124-2726(+)